MKLATTTLPVPGNDRTVALNEADVRRESAAAGDALAHTGAYISADRLSARPAGRKSPADCVVLIVEDDPDQLALADLRVSMAGYKVRIASSVNAFLQSMIAEGAPEDLRALQPEAPDAVLVVADARFRDRAVCSR